MSTNTKWTVSGSQLMKDGSPFFLKGVCYSPTPRGAATFAPGIGDWFYDKYVAIWGSGTDQRADLKTMNGLGINHLRTYFWWHWQWPDDGATWILNDSWKGDSVTTFDHTPFLDECAAQGIYVFMGLAVDGGNCFDAPSNISSHYLQFYKDTATALGKAYGSHPAVIGLVIGNEQNNASRNVRADFWEGLGEMASNFKAEATDKLTMVALQNDGNFFDYMVGDDPITKVFSEKFDICGLNIYGDMTVTLANYKSKMIEANSGDYAMPLIVSEWGAPAGKNVENPLYSDTDYNFPKTRETTSGTATIGPLEGPPFGIATAEELSDTEFETASASITKYFGEMTDNDDFVVGAEYFEWSDEWWKNYTDQKIIEAIDAGTLKLDQWGRFEFPYPMPAGYSGVVEYHIPTRITDQDGSSDPTWPEEYWGLYSIGENPKGDPGYTEYGYYYNADSLTARPTVATLSKAYTDYNPDS